MDSLRYMHENIYHTVNKTMIMDASIYSYTIKDHASCDGFSNDPVYSI